MKQVRAQGHEYWWIRPDVSAIFEECGYYIVPHHFYGPLPDPAEIAATRHDVAKYPLEKIGFSEKGCEELFSSIMAYWDEFKAFAAVSDVTTGFALQNPFYSGLDAFALYAMVRSRRPNQLIEIGSGFSTHIAYAAMQANGMGKITCIEPYPTAKLRELGGRVTIVESRVQQIDPALFAALGPNDICFIDSSHVSRLDSDVNYEVMQILPTLRPGVVAHIHDVFIPFEYPAHWLKERRWFWNEQYLLYAYLLGGEGQRYKIELPVFWALKKFRDRLAAMAQELPSFVATGTGIWLVRQ